MSWTSGFNLLIGTGLLLAAITMVAAVVNLYVLVRQMRRAINYNFSLVKRDIHNLNVRLSHGTHRDEDCARSYNQSHPSNSAQKG